MVWWVYSEIERYKGKKSRTHLCNILVSWCFGEAEAKKKKANHHLTRVVGSGIDFP